MKDDLVVVTGAGGALLNSPAFTGFPSAPTPPITSDDSSLATTAFVQEAIALLNGSIGGEIARIVTVADNPPLMPRQGALWWDSSSMKSGKGNLFIWYEDPTSSQWVVANAGPPGPPGPPGPSEPKGQLVRVTDPNPFYVHPDTDFVYIATVDAAGRTIRLPDTNECRSHSIRIVCAAINNDGALTISAAPGQFLLLPGATFWQFGFPSFTVDPISQGGPGTVDVVVTAHPTDGGSWTLGNFNRPFGATTPSGRAVVNGTVPMPPDGTPATAVLHADMTWS